jgi:hypothetical protein
MIKKMSKISKQELSLLKYYKVDKWLGLARLDKLFGSDVYTLLKWLTIEDQFTKEGRIFYETIQGNTQRKDIGFLTDVAVKAIEECSRGIANGKEKTLIDLGSGSGGTVWKELLAGCKTHAFDWAYGSDSVVSKNFDFILNTVVPANIIKEKLTKTNGNILTIQADHPELQNSFDIVTAQNILHYFNPNDCLKFAETVGWLLKPGGSAFITANAYHTDISCANFYNDNKKAGLKFPGFISHYKTKINDQIITECLSGDEKHDSDDGEVFLDNGETQSSWQITHHSFDLDTLRYIFQDTDLFVRDAYYMGNSQKGGISYIKTEENISGKQIDFAVIILVNGYVINFV